MSKLTKRQAGFVGPQESIRCGTCKYFSEEREKCKIVGGHIDAFSCCNLWTPPGKRLSTKFSCGKDIEDVLR